MPTDVSKIIYTAEDQTRAALASVTSNMEGAAAAATRLKTVFAGIAGGYVVSQIAESFRVVIQQGEELNKLAARTGIATESLSTLAYAARLANVDQESLAGGTKKLAVNMADAAGGGKEAAATFAAMGISVTDANGKLKGTDVVLREVADKFASYEDGAGKAALAVALFGKSGDQMIPMLNTLRQTEEEGRRVAAVYGGDFARAAEQVRDNMTKVATATEAARVKILEEFMPRLADLSDEFVRSFTEGNKLLAVMKALAALGGWREPAGANENNRKFAEDVDRLLTMQQRIEQQTLQKYNPRDPDSPSLKRMKEAAAALEADLNRQRVARMAGDADTLDARDLALRQKYPAPVVGGGETDKPRAIAREAKAEMRSVEDYATRLAQTVGRALNDSALVKTRELQDAVGELDRLFFEGRIPVDMYETAVQKLTGTLGTARSQADELAGVLSRTPDAISAQQERLVDEIRNRRGEYTDRQVEQMIAVIRGTREAAAATREARDVFQDFGLVMESATSRAIRNFQDLGEVARSVATDVAQMLFRDNVTRPAAAFASGALKAIMGGFGLGGASGGWVSGYDLPGRADGGPVLGGSAYIVGERGPEVFVPRSSGTIIPNGAGPSVFIDARNADRGGLARLEALVRQMNGTFEQRAVAAVAGARARNPAVLGA
jgi:hypothetical protein